MRAFSLWVRARWLLDVGKVVWVSLGLTKMNSNIATHPYGHFCFHVAPGQKIHVKIQVCRNWQFGVNISSMREGKELKIRSMRDQEW